MILQQRNYKGQFSYPQPIIFNDENHLLTVIALPWGNSDITEQGLQVFSDYYLSSLDDVESTSLFEKLSCFSDTLNNLRIAALLTNDYIYKHHNSSNLLGAMEFLAIAHTKNQISWIKVGGPNIFLCRREQNISPLAVSFSLQEELTSCVSPLPKNLLGVEKHCNMMLDSFILQENDHLILTTKNCLQTDFYSSSSQNRELQNISSLITSADPKQPFWIGLYEPPVDSLSR